MACFEGLTCADDQSKRLYHLLILLVFQLAELSDDVLLNIRRCPNTVDWQCSDQLEILIKRDHGLESMQGSRLDEHSYLP